MNKKKLQDYKLTGSLHTLSIKSPGVVENVPEDVSKCISSSSVHTKGVKTTSVINPNKLMGDVFKFSEFKTTMDTILSAAGITDYQLIRADMRFDSYDPEHYHRFTKLNRYLISMIAVTYATKNNYKAENLFSQKQLTVAIKNDYFELENYDRAAKSKNTGNHVEPAQARIEERTIGRGWRTIYGCAASDIDNMDLIKTEFSDSWFARWDKAVQNITEVHRRYNDELEMIYNNEKNSFPTRFRSLTDFLIQYQECIFCKSQMIDLLSRFEEVKNPKQRAENHKKRYGIEYFSQNDVQAAINEIKRATKEFFEN